MEFLIAIIFIISPLQALPNIARFLGGYNNRIVNGTSIDITEAPFMVSILYYGIFSCGGSLLTEKFVLTAAHCKNLSQILLIYSLFDMFQVWQEIQKAIKFVFFLHQDISVEFFIKLKKILFILKTENRMK